MTTETVYLLLPEIVLALVATLIYLGGALLGEKRGWAWLAGLSGVALASVALYQQQFHIVAAAAALTPGGAVILTDPFSTIVRWTSLAIALVFTLLTARDSHYEQAGEFVGSLLLICTGLMLAAVANDLVLFFVALELVSIPTYVVLYLGRGKHSLEAATKYFLLSVLASALLLYGFSFLYGAAGSTNLTTIAGALVGPSPGTGPFHTTLRSFGPLALLLIFPALAFRLTAVPFHFYAPDVYQGTSNANAGLLSVVPKVAALVAIVRIAYLAMPNSMHLGWQLALSLAIVTMTLGNLLALWQNNLRRLLAYSSIAHAGYMLIGLAIGFAVGVGAARAEDFDGFGAALFYLLVYAAATSGTFAALVYLGSRERPTSKVDDLVGLSEHYPRTAAAIAIFMFSLTGIPPLAGFWGKFSLFTGALAVDAVDTAYRSVWPWFLALAIAGAINAAISAAYYLRIVGVMYFRPAAARLDGEGGAGAAWATALCAALVLAIGLFPGALIARTQHAGEKLQSVSHAAAFNPMAAAESGEPAGNPSVAGR